jgi:hypothetical protein
MNPSAPERNKLPQATVVASAESREFRFQFHRLTSPGLLTYQVGVSDDLSNWDWSGRRLTEISPPQNTGDGLTERVTLSLRELPSAGLDPKFMRLRVLGGR